MAVVSSLFSFCRSVADTSSLSVGSSRGERCLPIERCLVGCGGLGLGHLNETCLRGVVDVPVLDITNLQNLLSFKGVPGMDG